MDISMDGWPLGLMCPPTRGLQPSPPGCPGPRPCPCPLMNPLLSYLENSLCQNHRPEVRAGCPLGAPAGFLQPGKEATLFSSHCAGLGSRAHGSSLFLTLPGCLAWTVFPLCNNPPSGCQDQTQ